VKSGGKVSPLDDGHALPFVFQRSLSVRPAITRVRVRSSAGKRGKAILIWSRHQSKLRGPQAAPKISLGPLLNAIGRSEFEDGLASGATAAAYEIGQRCRLERIFDTFWTSICQPAVCSLI
jgi:hypothetical protein